MTDLYPEIVDENVQAADKNPPSAVASLMDAQDRPITAAFSHVPP